MNNQSDISFWQQVKWLSFKWKETIWNRKFTRPSEKDKHGFN